MPYINPMIRPALDVTKDPQTAGELNYMITRLIQDYIKRTSPNGLNYEKINEIMGLFGVLECAKLEFYRRVAIPYEDKKCSENGDVYE